MFERFTRNARAVVVDAQSIAVRAGAPEVRPAHLFESLAARDGVLAMQVLAQLGAPADEVRRVVRGLSSRYSDGLDAEDAEALKLLGIDLDEVISRIDRDLSDCGGPITKGHRRLGRGSKKVLELSLREALQLGRQLHRDRARPARHHAPGRQGGPRDPRGLRPHRRRRTPRGRRGGSPSGLTAAQ